MQRVNRWGIAAAFAAIYLIWGSTYLAIGVAVATIPPVFMVAVRGLVAGAVLYAWSRARGGRAVTMQELYATVPTAALLFGGGYVLVGWAEQYVPSGPAALLNSTSPAFVVLLEWWRGGRARPRVRILLGLALGVFGVSTLVLGGGDAAVVAHPLAAGALLLASAAWAAGTVRAHDHAASDPSRTAAVQLLTGAALLFPVSLLAGEFDMVSSGRIETRSLIALAYLTVFGSLVGYSAYVWLLHQVSAARVASHSYVNPLIAVILGAVLAKEALSGAIIVAAVSIVAAVVFIVRDRQSDKTDRRAPTLRSLRGGVSRGNLAEPAVLDPT